MVLLFLGVAGLGVSAEHLFLVEFQADDLGVVDRLAGTSDVALSGDGLCVYATSEFEHAVTEFERTPIFGSLTFDEVSVDSEGGVFGLLAPSSVVGSPDGRHVYVTGAVDDTLLVYRRDATLDELVFVASQVKQNLVGGVVGLDLPTSVAVSGDGESVYVTAALDDSVAAFRRDATTDTLTFVEAEFDGFSADGLNGASGVAVSPDSQHVYVTGRADNAVTVFDRLPGGGLAEVATYFDGVSDVEGLRGAASVTVSPDGQHVYVVGAVDDSMVTFLRNPFTGTLTFQDAIYDGQDGVDGLDGAADVLVNPAGDRVVAASPNDNGLALFRRDPASGDLVFLDALLPPDGLRGARSLATHDGIIVYAAAYADDGVAGVYVALCEGDEGLGDSDADAICDDLDSCLGDDFLGDEDSDAVCDDLDICPGGDDSLDDDGDTVPDACDACEGNDATGDSDADMVCDDTDTCPGFDDGLDADGDNVADGCDVCEGDDATGDSDTDAVCDDLDVCAGFDDGIDADGDTVPDGCDDCFGDDLTGDSDGDQVCDDLDVCAAGDDNLDDDGDAVPDACDACDGDDATGDSDGDLVCDDIDCAPDDDSAAYVDACGVCGGTAIECPIFFDGFESGSTSAWSSVTGGS
ncbi:MAG: beta-propeller fold lactonase family protein [Thermoanaerobaculia bacterium]|nr:beta-propeller fold lactonase family protein [Thermoanaerobaculia bacterium]